MEINIASHLEIVNYMLAMDFDQAAESMSNHIEEGRNTAVYLLSGQ